MERFIKGLFEIPGDEMTDDSSHSQQSLHQSVKDCSLQIKSFCDFDPGGVSELFCILASDQHWRPFLSVLERLPNVPLSTKRIPHLKFWDEEVVFLGTDILRDCIPNLQRQSLFAAALVLAARLTYARDVCLPRCLDDAAINVGDS